MSQISIFITGLVSGCFIGFFIAALLGANKEISYTEDFLLEELYEFKKYWLENLESEHDKELAKVIIEDFILGLMNGFRRD